jgi:hypothetical protein
MTMKFTVFWDVTPCSLVEIFRHFGATSVNMYQTTWRHNTGDSNFDLIDFFFRNGSFYKTFVPFVKLISREDLKDVFEIFLDI